MNKIGKVKLGINNELDVVIVSDVSMNGEADKDDLYFVMFNIMHEPLRLSVTTVGDLLTLAKINTEKSEEELLKLSRISSCLREFTLLLGSAWGAPRWLLPLLEPLIA